MRQWDSRSYLEWRKKEAPEEIRFVEKTVDPRFQLPAIIAKLESLNRYPAFVFNHVQRRSLPVVSNLFSTRKSTRTNFLMEKSCSSSCLREGAIAGGRT